ncbi:MAG: HPP family protein [Gammaproteobacteria bacterium SHHR-1]|uniref:HPP family protein n=1 Tax=Magnetovirga frankeli TaxID=947516 RepID=UPI001AFC44D4|nr:HPP family protein [gamma proteobacterium SS-5]
MTDRKGKSWWRYHLGLAVLAPSWRERLVAVGGSLLTIFALYQISLALLGESASPLIVASMGATVMLLFVIPHGPLSQPWPIFGGQLISALVGLACAHYVGHDALSAALAVSLAILAMQLIRALHPPGCATALFAATHTLDGAPLGYAPMLGLMLTNLLPILALGVLLNLPFAWRRYPARLASAATPVAGGVINHEDLVMALSEMDTFVDINEDDLLRIYALATHGKELKRLHTTDIAVGETYRGANDERRQVVEIFPSEQGSQVRFRVLNGPRRGKGSCSLYDFSHWAQDRV